MAFRCCASMLCIAMLALTHGDPELPCPPTYGATHRNRLAFSPVALQCCQEMRILTRP